MRIPRWGGESFGIAAVDGQAPSLRGDGTAGVQELQIGDQISGRRYDVVIDDVTVLRGT